VTIRQIVPAAAGWRLVQGKLDGDPLRIFDDAELAADQLIIVRPIACFAMCIDDDDPAQTTIILPVCPDDWPSYLYPISSREEDNVIDQLGPGEKVTQFHLEEARKMIRQRTPA